MEAAFSIRSRVNSMRYALSGIRLFFKAEHNAKLHLISSAGVLLSGIFLSLSALEWIAILFCIGAVWTAEIFNTCVERIMDYLTKETLMQVKQIKDMAAAAVLVTSLSALIIALIIFIPKILALV